MRKDFRGYSEDRKSSPGSEQSGKLNMDAQDAMAFAQQYQGKSQGEIMAEILKMSSKGKKDGSVNIEQIENFAQTLSPSLTEEQRVRLSEMLKLIKNS